MMFKENDKIVVTIPEYVKDGFNINDINIPNDLIIDIRECPIRSFIEYHDMGINIAIHRKNGTSWWYVPSTWCSPYDPKVDRMKRINEIKI